MSILLIKEHIRISEELTKHLESTSIELKAQNDRKDLELTELKSKLFESERAKEQLKLELKKEKVYIS
jgi:hypothetical protein